MSFYDQITTKLAKMYLNVFLAIILGIVLDVLFNRMNLSNIYLRIILQFGLGMLIIILINSYYETYNLDPAHQGPFFSSVFLAVQLSLFKDIYSLSSVSP